MLDAHTLRRDILQDLLGPWKHGNGPRALILTGTHRLRPAVEAAEQGGPVSFWLHLDDA
ncbi:hypothetical protein ACFU7T_14420 [Streptomyces sp. NPDC057555]|uniref:hypothetical protein n=1 Tax=Streptomyces sp. NPDC057555 TaxID=3346166 RepID=UPI0036BA4B49